ncbi:MAG: hypothetical protein AB7O79_08460 [Xanthobacteraceae bacterium]
MAAVTYSPKFAPEVAATAKTGKSFWARVWDRIVEARMRQVEREIRMHMSYMPQEVVEHYKNLPFQR